MGFDAGKITAHMELGTDGFNEAADEVEQKKEDLGKPVEIPVEANTDEADEKLDALAEKKDEAKKPVTFAIEADGRPAIEEAKATDEAVKSELHNPTITPRVDGAPAVLEAEATGRAVKQALDNPFVAGAFPQGNMIDMLLGTGSSEDAAQALKSLNGGTIADARKMISDFTDFQISEAMRARAGVLSAASGWHMIGEGGGAHYGLPIGPVPQMAATLLGDQAALSMGGTDAAGMALFDANKAEAFARQWEQAVLNGPSRADWALGTHEFPTSAASDLWGQLGGPGGEGLPALGRGTLPWSDYGGTGAGSVPIDAKAWVSNATSGTDPIWKQMGLQPMQAEGFRYLNGSDGESYSDLLGGSGGGSYAKMLADLGFNEDGTAIETEAQKFAKKWKADAATALQDAQLSVFDSVGSKAGSWSSIFKGKSGIADDIGKAAKKLGVDVGKDFTDALSKSILDEAKSSASFGGGGGGIIDKLLGGASSAAQSIVGGAGSALQSFSGLSPALTGAAVAAPLVVPILGAVGLAAGGAAAGTAIGSAGLLTALIPGLLDLGKGYSAYGAEKTFAAAGGASGPNGAANSLALAQATAGDSPTTLATAGAIGNLVGSGTSLLGKAETLVAPDVLKFLNALATALPKIAPFAKNAITSLSGFFNTVDRGLSSQGFKSFMQTMSKDVGPIMDDFGKFTEHAGTAIGGFLKLFGGAPAQAVGAWFDRVSGNLSRFLNKATISPGFMAGMTQAFNFLGAALDVVWRAGDKVFQALAPIGLTLMKFLTPALQGLGGILNAIPVNVLTALAVGFLALTVATSPLLLLAAAILAVGYAFKTIQTDLAGNYKPMTAADITNAFAGELGGKTPADIAAVKHAQDLGLTPGQIYNAYVGQAPVRVKGSGYTSPLDSSTIPGQGGSDPAGAKARAARQATQNPQFGIFSKENIARTAKDARNWWQDTENIAAGILSGGANWFTKSLPHFFSKIPSMWDSVSKFLDKDRNRIAHVFDDITGAIAGWVTKSLPHAWDRVSNVVAGWYDDISGNVRNLWHNLTHDLDNVKNGIANWVTKSLPHAWDRVSNVVAGWYDDISGNVRNIWHNLSHDFDNVETSIANWVTKSLPHAFDNIGHVIKGAFADAGTWLKDVGKAIINGLIDGINAAINFANGHDPSILGVHLFPTIHDIPHFADGGPVLGPPGQPQLAVVHGGEYVLSQAMLARGGAGHTPSVVVNVDARGSGNPAAVQSAAQSGVMATIPQLTRAIKRAA